MTQSASQAFAISVDDASYAYQGRNGRVQALQGVSLRIRHGEFVAIVGRSGSGKSTLLRLIGGLLRANSGAVHVHGAPVLGPPPRARFVAQDYTQSLLPWLTVENNIRFGSRHAVDAGGPVNIVPHVADLVGLGHALRRYPRELSGGMQQRVAIARALASRPDVLLLDEAFGSVDALSRAQLQDMVLQLWQQLGFTAILVTHDIDEAAYLADRVVVMDARGRGLAASLPIDLQRPRHQVSTRESTRYLESRRALLDHVLTPEPARETRLAA
ncbi:MAG: ABC transporter ATP-binding protein [Burkholderiaceae bacterium]|nr:ABC transporter ATP-binding protein [Burkholderiaceae bacterium]